MKRILFAVLALMAAAGAFAQTAVFKELRGKVEYQLEGKEWRPAKTGLEVPKGTMISTGFKSLALIVLGKANVLVKPLTRLTIEEIVRREGSEGAMLFLVSGRIRAEVTPESGKTLDFSVRSPIATAAVRGCAFDFDGVNLVVTDERVYLISPIQRSRTVSGGEVARLADDLTVEAPRDLQEQASRVISTSDFGFKTGDSGERIIPPPLGSTFVITIE